MTCEILLYQFKHIKHPPWTCVWKPSANTLPNRGENYILENIYIICNLFQSILGYTNFQSSRTSTLFSCFIFQDILPQSMTRVFKLFILFCLSLIIPASSPQLHKNFYWNALLMTEDQFSKLLSQHQRFV